MVACGFSSFQCDDNDDNDIDCSDDDDDYDKKVTMVNLDRNLTGMLVA